MKLTTVVAFVLLCSAFTVAAENKLLGHREPSRVPLAATEFLWATLSVKC